jgi:molybdopterin-binding protein
VSPREITLYAASPTAGSAQNVFRGPVVEMVPEPPFGERVRVVLGTRPPLVAEVTQAAVDRLGLAVGTQVYASFKATAVSTYS